MTSSAATPAPVQSGLCQVLSSHLVVIDVQSRLGAVMPEKVLNRVIRNARLLLTVAGLLDIPVTLTEQYPRGLGPTDDTLLAVLPSTCVRLEKTCFSCAALGAFTTRLDTVARRQVILIGMEAHVCVLQSAAELKAAGWDVFVVEDAVCSRRLENYQNAIERLRGLDCTVTNAESLVFEWLRDASHEHFKTISALLR